jgi:hypothetical protein
MQTLYRQSNLGWIPGSASAAEATPTPALSIDQLPASVALGREQVAEHRPRVLVVQVAAQRRFELGASHAVLDNRVRSERHRSRVAWYA